MKVDRDSSVWWPATRIGCVDSTGTATTHCGDTHSLLQSVESDMMYRDDAMLALRAEFWWRNPKLLNEVSPVFTHTTTSTFFSLCVKIVYNHHFDLAGLPMKILGEIGGHLELQDLKSCSLTCKAIESGMQMQLFREMGFVGTRI